MPGVEALVEVFGLSPFSVLVVQSEQDFDLIVSEFSESICAEFSCCPCAVPQVVLLAVRLKVSVVVDDGSSSRPDRAKPWPAQKETGFAYPHQPLCVGCSFHWKNSWSGSSLPSSSCWCLPRAGIAGQPIGHCPRSDTVGAPRSLLPPAGQAVAPARSRFPLVPPGFCWLLLTVLT